jgi:hypothetical protein
MFFREQRIKNDIKLYPNGTISYRELRNYTFDRTKSSFNETLTITTINVVYMVKTKIFQIKSIQIYFHSRH